MSKNDLIRHKVLKVLVQNYNEVLAKYGEDGHIFPPDDEKLAIPIQDIAKKIKARVSDVEAASSKAFKEKSYKFEKTNDIDECYTLSENSFLHYNEQTYLKQSRPFFFQTDFKKSISIAILAALLSFGINYFIQSGSNKNKDRLDKTQNDEIKILRDSLEVLKNRIKMQVP